MNVATKTFELSSKTRDFLDKTHRMLIDGEWVDAASGKTFAALDPATGAVVGSVPEGDKVDVDRAVAAARRTFDDRTWTGLSASRRAAILWRVGDLIDERVEEIVELEVLNQGMPRAVAGWTMLKASEVFRYYAGWVTKIHGETSSMDDMGMEYHAYTRREPIGVAGLIVPWNGPFLFACAKLAVALAAGCSCVLKPAEETPISALLLGEILVAAGVPAGVVNIVTGYGDSAGAAITEHPHVDKIGFTGSTEVGKRIVRAATGNLKRVTLELGGKSPVIVFDDADVAKTVAGAAMGIFNGSGQMCVAGSRVYVQRKLYEPIVLGLSFAASSLKLGNGFDPDAHLGPLVSAKQLKHVTDLVTSAPGHGAEVMTGGERWGDDGFFFKPTVLADPAPDSRVMREEIFGPVVAVTPFDDVEEVLALANDTDYGLAAAVWTQDVSRVHRMAARLQAGTIWVNCQLASDMSVPFGGYKQSGWGREFGKEGIDAYLQTKSVIVAL